MSYYVTLNDITGVKANAIPCTGLQRPCGLQEDDAPCFQDNQHMKAVRLSALRTPRKYSWYSFLLKTETTPGP